MTGIEFNKDQIELEAGIGVKAGVFVSGSPPQYQYVAMPQAAYNKLGAQAAGQWVAEFAADRLTRDARLDMVYPGWQMWWSRETGTYQFYFDGYKYVRKENVLR